MFYTFYALDHIANGSKKRQSILGMTILLSSQKNEMFRKIDIEGTHFFLVENVSDFSFCDKNNFSYTIDTFPDQPDAPMVVYLNIELEADIAFAHFCYESAIYLPYFHHLRTLFPGLKLIIKRPRVYKKLFYRLFDISEDCVVNSIDTSCNNIVIFPNPDTALNDSILTDHWKKNVLQFFFLFSQGIHSPLSTQQEVIILPRQTKENCVYNDRKFPLYSILQYAQGKNAYILHTDDITDFKDQIRLLRSSNKIILTDGSPFLVNGLFVNDKKIFIIDTLTEYQSQKWPKYNFIIQCIKNINKNSIHYFTTEQSFLDFLVTQPTFFSLQ